MGAVREAEHVGVAQRRGLLLGGVGDRAHALERSRDRAAPRRWPRAPRPSAGRRAAPVRARRGDLRSRCSVRCRGDGHDVVGDLRGAPAWARQATPVRRARTDSTRRRMPGEASSSSARSTSERRTRQVRPARTAASRPLLTQARTVAGWSFSSSLTCGDGQPRIFSRCRRTGVRVGHSEPSSTENHDIEVCHI